MNNSKVLIVEDDHNLRETLFEFLQMKGYQCLKAASCTEAKSLFSDSIKVILMDIDLPDGSGLELAQSFRKENKNFILLFLSAINDPETRYEGLNLGAQDYITKPFDLREIILRLERIMNYQSSVPISKTHVEIGNIKFWFSRFEIEKKDKSLTSLSQKECMILKALYDHQGEVVSRDKLINDIWGEEAFPTNRTVDNYIVKLRKILDLGNNEQASIATIRGVGYKLDIKNKDEQ